MQYWPERGLGLPDVLVNVTLRHLNYVPLYLPVFKYIHGKGTLLCNIERIK